MDIDTLVNGKIEADTEFQETIAFLEDEEKEAAIATKRNEVLAQEFATLQEKADRAEKAEELANNYKVRAEKAEKHEKPKKEEGELGTKDLYALMSANVPQDDVDEVVKASKLLGKPIAEVINDPIVKTILQTRAEYRATANATSTTTARPSVKKMSDADILERANKGEIPEKGTEEAERLFWARRGGKR